MSDSLALFLSGAVIGLAFGIAIGLVCGERSYRRFAKVQRLNFDRPSIRADSGSFTNCEVRHYGGWLKGPPA